MRGERKTYRFETLPNLPNLSPIEPLLENLDSIATALAILTDEAAPSYKNAGTLPKLLEDRICEILTGVAGPGG